MGKIGNNFKLDLIGHRFGRLVVVKEGEPRLKPNGKKTRRWICQCDCGKQSLSDQGNLTSGGAKSCGCGKVEATIKRCTTHGCAAYRNPDPEYRTWQAMINRCTNAKCSKYHVYGGRGIKVCQRWLDSFSNFLEDMGRRPSNKHTLDRINNEGHYEPGNCRWATQREQTNNQRKNVRIEWQGRTQTAAQWEHEFGWRVCLANRLRQYGWPLEKAMTTPPKEKRRKSK